ncbi:NADH-quinone oxidoreductase subunit NuoG [Asaia sp. BMEF1]|uniref:NADH-quinone oxidoreductase subunit NuoG n=1 Tax=Asaia sp. BMEF1 TaxID=3155932 RepID=UPI003F663CDD
MAKIVIDGREVEARTDVNLLQACLEAGKDLPYFCWHPELGSVGACRQCAVKQYANADDTRGRIVMACMTPVTEGAIISVEDPEAKEFRGEVVEWLMTNHPHDCPVCEEGGECHLQDMTVMTGHRERRYRFDKRTHNNQELGPFVKHEMNRCISCYRCVRFYRDYAGGEDLGVFASHNNVYFGRHESGTLESPFSGNLIEVCPTGVFTDKPFSKMYSRKWDMRGAPSVCSNCATGCNTIINERAGKVRRTLNRYNDEVNRYFLCDRGRFGHGWVNAPTRLRSAGYVIDGDMTPVPAQAALDHFGKVAASGKLVGIGSPRASLESNYALRKLVGAENFSTGMAEPEHSLVKLAVSLLTATHARIATMQEMETADGALILGEDVSATSPRMSLALRQIKRTAFNKAADQARVPHWMDASVRTLGQDTISPLFVVSPTVTDLDGFAQEAVRAMPDDAARLGFAIAHRIDASAPDVTGLTDAETAAATRIAETLLAAEKPLLVSGLQYASPALLQATANIASALAAKGKTPLMSFVLPEANSMGLALMDGLPLDAVTSRAADATLIVLENDLSRRLDGAQFDALVGGAANLVVLDHSVTPTAIRSQITFPSAAYSETDGTLVSAEGRAQRFFQVVYPDAPLQAGWRWIVDMAQAAGFSHVQPWARLDDLIAEIATTMPVFARIPEAAPGSEYTLEGTPLRSQTHRVSGRTAIRANISVRDIPPPSSPDTPLHSTMEGSYGTDMPGTLVPFYQVPGWNSEQALNRFQQEIGGKMRGGDSGVRLVEGAEGAGHGYAMDVPNAFAARAGQVMLLPEARVFGTDEMSMMAQPIAERAAPAYIRVGGALAEGARVRLSLNGEIHTVDAVYDPTLPEGVATCPPHMVSRSWSTPGWVSLEITAPAERIGTESAV